MSGFGSSVVLGDLSDYISPSQACVNPIFSENVNKRKKKEGNVEDVDGPKITIDLDETFPTADSVVASSSSSIGTKSNLILESTIQTAQVSLNDCLACSGCVTSAETVLIEQQSVESLYKAMRSGKKMLVVSISEESRASLGAHFGISANEVQWKLRTLFRKIWTDSDDTVFVLDAGAATDVALVESGFEFVERFKNRQACKWTTPTKRTIAVSATQERVILPGTTMDFDAASNHTRTAAQSAAVVAASLPKAQKARPPGPHTALPMIVSACPGWVCYAEKRHPEVLPYMSSTKSPQQILGTFAKIRLPRLVGRSDISARDVLHVSVMACFDKKLEASRLDFWHNEDEGEWKIDTDSDAAHEVDLVLTSGEIIDMLKKLDCTFDDLPESIPCRTDLEWRLSNFFDRTTSHGAVDATRASSGGFLEYVYRFAAKTLYNVDAKGPLAYKSPRRCTGDFEEVSLTDPENAKRPRLRFAKVYGFRHIQKIIRQLRTNTCKYHFIEIMACPNGCLNGGGQTKPDDFVSVQADALLQQVRATFQAGRPSTLIRSNLISESPLVRHIHEWLGSESRRKQMYLHTRYHAIPELPKNPLAISW